MCVFVLCLGRLALSPIIISTIQQRNLLQSNGEHLHDFGSPTPRAVCLSHHIYSRCCCLFSPSISHLLSLILFSLTKFSLHARACVCVPAFWEDSSNSSWWGQFPEGLWVVRGRLWLLSHNWSVSSMFVSKCVRVCVFRSAVWFSVDRCSLVRSRSGLLWFCLWAASVRSSWFRVRVHFQLSLVLFDFVCGLKTNKVTNLFHIEVYGHKLYLSFEPLVWFCLNCIAIQI